MSLATEVCLRQLRRMGLVDKQGFAVNDDLDTRVFVFGTFTLLSDYNMYLLRLKR